MIQSLFSPNDCNDGSEPVAWSGLLWRDVCSVKRKKVWDVGNFGFK